MGNPLEDFKDLSARITLGMTKTEAHTKQICIDCKLPIDGRLKTEAGAREYQISGICELCWDDMFKQPKSRSKSPK